MMRSILIIVSLTLLCAFTFTYKNNVQTGNPDLVPLSLSSGDIKTVNGQSLIGSGNVSIGGLSTQHQVAHNWFMNYSSGIFGISQPTVSDVTGAQPTLVSGTNIKTLGGLSLLGSSDYGTLAVGYGGTGTGTAFTQDSVVYAGASGIYTQDANNFYYNPTGGPGSSPTLQIGPRASNPIDAEYEFYTATTGTNVAHFHNTGVQSSTGGAIISLNAVPIGAAIASGSRLGSFQFGGAQDTSQTLGVGAAMGSVATENWSSSAHGSTLDFKTIPNGSTTRTTSLTLNQDQSATFANTVNATTFVGAVTGAATSAATLTTPRTINGVSFNGSTNITVNAVDSTARALLAGSSSQSFSASALSVGSGGTTSPATVTLNGGSTTGYGPLITWQSAGTTIGYTGTYNSIFGSAGNDMTSYVASGLGYRWYVNAHSSTPDMQLDSSAILHVGGNNQWYWCNGTITGGNLCRGNACSGCVGTWTAINISSN